MTTSAQNLNNILAVASREKDKSAQFNRVFANQLGLESPEAEAEVVVLLYRLFSQISDDI